MYYPNNPSAACIGHALVKYTMFPCYSISAQCLKLVLCFRFTKPQTFADCVGDELPFGWEQAYHPEVGVYYTNHNDRK